MTPFPPLFLPSFNFLQHNPAGATASITTMLIGTKRQSVRRRLARHTIPTLRTPKPDHPTPPYPATEGGRHAYISNSNDYMVGDALFQAIRSRTGKPP